MQDKHLIYRGLASDDYMLIPSVLRKKIKYPYNVFFQHNTENDFEYIQIRKEYRVLKLFFDYCDLNNLYVPIVRRIRDNLFNDFDFEFDKIEEWISPDLYELAALAQHYGLPTRLMDWSYNILISLYFAVSERMKAEVNERNQGNIVIWALDTEFVEYQGSPIKLVRPLYCENPNLAAQKGLFTLWREMNPIKTKFPLTIDTKRTNRQSLDALLEQYCIECDNDITQLIHLYKIIIPANNIQLLYKHLKKNGIDACSIFPDYYGVERCIKEDILSSLIKS